MVGVRFYLLMVGVVMVSLIGLVEGNIYCLISKEHSLCKVHDVGKKCGPNFQRKVPSEENMEVILDWHNTIRSRVALGKETEAEELLPQAANMMKLRWDDELAEIAQAHANQCVFEHDCKDCREVDGKRFKVGQNVGIGVYSGSDLPDEIDWTRLMEGWYTGEVDIFKKSYITDFKFGRWGHFSQVIWWNTRSVGCGASIHTIQKTSYHLLVCNYGRAGNIGGAKVYRIGTVCSDCPTETHCDTKYPGLCGRGQNITVKAPFVTDDLYIYHDNETVSEKEYY